LRLPALRFAEAAGRTELVLAHRAEWDVRESELLRLDSVRRSGLSLPTTIKLDLTAPDGSAAHQIGSAISLLSACGSGSETTISIPTAGMIPVQNQLLELTVSSLASLSLAPGEGITLQAIGFNGPEY
jgi:hypothetical protein